MGIVGKRDKPSVRQEMPSYSNVTTLEKNTITKRKETDDSSERLMLENLDNEIHTIQKEQNRKKFQGSARASSSKSTYSGNIYYNL
jgi:hypothetical protein